MLNKRFRKFMALMLPMAMLFSGTAFGGDSIESVKNAEAPSDRGFQVIGDSLGREAILDSNGNMVQLGDGQPVKDRGDWVSLLPEKEKGGGALEEAGALIQEESGDGNIRVLLSDVYYPYTDSTSETPGRTVTTRPFYLKVVSLNRAALDDVKRLTLKVTIDGKEVKESEDSGYYYEGYDNFLVIDDMGVEPGDHSLMIEIHGRKDDYLYYDDESDSESIDRILYSAAKTVTFAQDGPFMRDYYLGEKYLTEGANPHQYFNLEMCIPGSFEGSEIEGIYLLDSSGKIVAMSDNYYLFNSSYGDPRYGASFYNNSYDWEHTEITTYSWSRAAALGTGDYSVMVSMADGDKFTAEKKIHVVGSGSKAVVTGMDFDSSSDLDDSGYFIVRMEGLNLDPDKVWPVLYYNGEAVTDGEPDSWIRDDGDSEAVEYYIFKLKKTPDFESKMSSPHEFTAGIDTALGYAVEDAFGYESLYYYGSDRSPVRFSHYNYKKGYLEAYAYGSVAPGTQVKCTVKEYRKSSDGDSDSGYYADIAYGEDSVDSNHELQFSLKDGSGKAFTPETAKNYDYSVFYQVEGQDKEYSKYGGLRWYNYAEEKDSSESVPVINDTKLFYKDSAKIMELDIRLPFKELDKVAEGEVAVEVEDVNSEDTVFSETEVSYEKETQDGREYAVIEEEMEFDSPLDVGRYRVTISAGQDSEDDGYKYTFPIFVFDSRFYQFYQSNYFNGDGISLTVGDPASAYAKQENPGLSAEKAWKDAGYTIQVFDGVGNEIKGFSIGDYEWGNYDYANDSVLIVRIKDFSLGVKNAFIKVTKNGGLGLSLSGSGDSSASYYSEYSYRSANLEERFGMNTYSYGLKGALFNSESYKYHGYYGVLVYRYGLESSASPKVGVYEVGDFEPIKTISPTRSGDASSGNEYFYFKASDLDGIDMKRVYDLRIFIDDEVWESDTGYLISAEQVLADRDEAASGGKDDDSDDRASGGKDTTSPDSVPSGSDSASPDSIPGGSDSTSPDSIPGGGDSTSPDSIPGGGDSTSPDSIPDGGSSTSPDSIPGGGSSSNGGGTDPASGAAASENKVPVREYPTPSGNILSFESVSDNGKIALASKGKYTIEPGITVTSSDPKVVKISKKGKISVKKAGVVMLTLLKGAKTKSVIAAVEKVKVKKVKLALGTTVPSSSVFTGVQFVLPDSDIVSTNPSVIAVSGNVVNASKMDDIKLVVGSAGKTTLQAAFGGKVYKKKIKVSPR